MRRKIIVWQDGETAERIKCENNGLGEWERMNQEGTVWLSGRIRDPLEAHGHGFQMRSVRRVLVFLEPYLALHNSSQNADTV